jgi:hypothetical protein
MDWASTATSAACVFCNKGLDLKSGYMYLYKIPTSLSEYRRSEQFPDHISGTYGEKCLCEYRGQFFPYTSFFFHSLSTHQFFKTSHFIQKLLYDQNQDDPIPIDFVNETIDGGSAILNAKITN